MTAGHLDYAPIELLGSRNPAPPLIVDKSFIENPNAIPV